MSSQLVRYASAVATRTAPASSLISAIIVFHALSGSACVRAGALKGEASIVPLAAISLAPPHQRKIYIPATRRERGKQDSEITTSAIVGDGDPRGHSREESAPFRFIARLS